MYQPLLDKKFWDDRYNNRDTGWDMGKASAPLKDYIDQLTDKNIAILIPGCGNAYEATYLIEKGFTNITLIDISPVLVSKLRERLTIYDGRQLHIICGDFFALDQQFDLILEQTFFCALAPEQRKDYVDRMNEVLKPGGKLAGLLFNRSFEGGPPFSGSKEEYEKLFSEKFAIRKMEDCYNSIAQRKGSELFVILKKLPLD